MRVRSFILYFLTVILIAFIFSGSSPEKKDDIRQIVKHKLSSDFFTRLYSNTYYSLLSRIDSDGYLQESLTGQYDGMYCRTVGAIVPLLLETKNYEKAEMLLKFVFKVMKMYKMNRVPHVIGQKVIHIGNTEQDSIYIIGKTDQIDGQAHNILAWAQLALQRGYTSFEDSTWNFVSGLMDHSTEEPYMGSNKKGFIADLIHNFNFEHSRPLPTSYDLLTQCFIGSALEDMIQVAKRRNDASKIKLWSQRLNRLKAGIGKYLTRKLNGKQIYLELLSKEGESNKPFLGFSWVNLSPVAAQWEPLNHKVLINTINEMRKQMMQQWNNFTWMPTENWPNGDFPGQMIGKGIGWEIEYARKEKDWEWINQILSMLEIIQHDEPIYMENSFLTAGSNHSIEYLNQKELKRMYNGVWKIVDPGNGEQAAWWCWAIAKLRSEVGMPAIPEKLCPAPEIEVSNQNRSFAHMKITSSPGTLVYYSTDGSEPSNNSTPYSNSFYITKPTRIKAVAYNKNNIVSNIKTLNVSSVYNGLEFSYYPDIKADNNFNWINNSPSNTGYTKVFDFESLMANKNKYGLSFKGYLKINREGNYKFFIITLNHSRLYIDNQLISFDINSLSDKNKINGLYLNQGFHKLKLESEFNEGKNNVEIYFSRNNQPKEIIDSSMLLVKDPNDKAILPPLILPFKPEFDIDEPVSVSISSLDGGKIYYTLNGSNPDENSFLYKNPFEINSTTTLKAVAVKDKQISPVSIMNFIRTEKTKIALKYAPNSKYSALGTASLIDGIHGTVNSRDGNWLGFEGDDFDAILDLRKIKNINEIKTEFLNSPGSWIFLPEEIKYFISNDGTKFREVFSTAPDTLLQHNKISDIKEYDVKLNNEKARFVRVFAKNIGFCPKWHPGAGNKSWIFVDEITIK